jgi:hypothetical protein
MLNKRCGNGGHERQASFPFAPHTCGNLVTGYLRCAMSRYSAHPSPRSTDHGIAHESEQGNTGSPYARCVPPVDHHAGYAADSILSRGESYIRCLFPPLENQDVLPTQCSSQFPALLPQLLQDYDHLWCRIHVANIPFTHFCHVVQMWAAWRHIHIGASETPILPLVQSAPPWHMYTLPPLYLGMIFSDLHFAVAFRPCSE